MTLVPSMANRGQVVRALQWSGDERGHLRILDQTALPLEVRELALQSADQVHDAIHRLAIRGAPAIGLAGAYGLVLGMRDVSARDGGAFLTTLETVASYLSACRPTAVNLTYAIDRSVARIRQLVEADAPPASLQRELLANALQMHHEDEARCQAMGRAGAALLRDGDAILTHCNAGALATGGIGTALSVAYAAHASGKRIHVYADETRPLLQGARLTAWELHRAGIQVTLICDSAAASVLGSGRIQAIFVGADRIAANGDTANKIGTQSVALAAAHHGVPFYVVAPSSTFDLDTPDGTSIPIEERSAAEITSIRNHPITSPGVATYNPAFDVTPAHLIRGFITEEGLLLSPTPDTIRSHLLPPRSHPSPA